jgi:hypothetical protein
VGRCLKPGLVGAGGAASVVGGDAAGGPLGADPKLPLESADGDEAESVRVRLRERVSSPCGDDEGAEPASHPPGGGGCGAVLRSSRCILLKASAP